MVYSDVYRPLNNVALAVLQTLRERCDGKAVGHITVRSCRKWFKTCLKKAAFTTFSTMISDHTLATRLRRNGIPLEDIAAPLNHDVRELRMTRRYAHVDIMRLHAAVRTRCKPTQKLTHRRLLKFRTRSLYSGSRSVGLR